MRTPAELLDLPVAQSSRWLALRFLDEAAAAHGRMEDARDAEALHDFRVGLRRLRSTLRAYEPYLAGSVGRKDRRRVRRLARATGGARDAEVHIEWLEKRRDPLSKAEKAGARWLLARLRDAQADAEEAMRAEVARDFTRERWRLARRLRFFRVEVALDDPAGGPLLATVLGRLALDAVREVEEHLARVRSIADQEEAHEARIAAKRLRYLVEPFQQEAALGPESVKRMKKLQDVLGEMHDAEVLLATVREALEELGDPAGDDDGDREQDRDRAAAAEPDASAEADAAGADAADARDGARKDEEPASAAADGDDPRVGLRRLAGMLEAERAERYAELEAKWLGGRGAEAFAQVRELAREIAAAGRGDLEIERKFLLRRMPNLDGAMAEVWEIDQGWLPGERLAERLRRVRSQEGVKYYRTVKLGAGASRFELEEETTEAVFCKLWSLTRGKRVRKLRYRVQEGGLTWEIDRFRGRRLVLAEVELPTEDAKVDPPAWLRRLIVRDVTDEPDYVNINLAR
jgi:CHAD domain-containing protein/CYTH domain-containing protein